MLFLCGSEKRNYILFETKINVAAERGEGCSVVFTVTRGQCLPRIICAFVHVAVFSANVSPFTFEAFGISPAPSVNVLPLTDVFVKSRLFFFGKSDGKYGILTAAEDRSKENNYCRYD